MSASKGPTDVRMNRRELGRKVGGTLIGSMLAGSAGVALAQAADAGDAFKGKITYWFWGESDVPGIDQWMATRVANYKKRHPGVEIDIVPQAIDTLVGTFRLAAQSRSGPDIATQWATLPTLAPYWNGSSVPISDFIPASETQYWINTSENTVGGKIIAMPLYLIGIPFVWNKALFKKAGLDPDKAPATWDDLLSACKTLKASGITPIGMGNKDGYFGAWMFAIYAKQQLDSLDQLKAAIADTGSFTMEQFGDVLRKLYGMMQVLVQEGYLNSDVSSLDLSQGAQLFPQQQVAMAFNTDSVVRSWAGVLGQETIGVALPPKWGNSKLADTYNVTQSSGAFITSWAKDKLAAATFLAWLHQPENMQALYEIGAFPADKRFPIDSVSDPLARKLLQLGAGKESIWLENYIPPQVDGDANLPAGQLILSGSGTPDEAVAIWDRVVKQWRRQQPAEFENFKKWATGG